MMTLPSQRCGKCYYFRFNGLTKWCRHPDINREIHEFGKDRAGGLFRLVDEKGGAPVKRVPFNDLQKETQ